MRLASSSRPLTLGCVVALVAAASVAGCGGDPSTSSSEEKATIKGVVTYQGKPVKKGTITFDPSNANRRMAAPVSAPLGADGSYTVTSLVGRNMVSFDLPELATVKQLQYFRTDCNATKGDNTLNIDLPSQ